MALDLQDLSRRLFKAAETLWTNTGLRPDQYAQPVLALIALRQMEAKFLLVDAELKPKFTGRLKPSPDAYQAAFYRAVEATSVAPWAARALDRALAAVVVSLARHLLPEMAHGAAVRHLADHPDLQAKVRQTILDRAPEHGVAGGKAALGAAVDRLLAGWIELAQEQTTTGGDFYFGPATHALLHDPLDPKLSNLDPMYRSFVAGRSMRDVEATVPLDIRQPNGALLNLT